MRPKNLIPLAHVEHGWVFGNSIAVFGEDIGELVHVPIDELDRYYTLPFGVVIAPDKSAAYVSTTGSDSVTVIDITRLLAFLRAASPRARARWPTTCRPRPTTSRRASRWAARPKGSRSRPMASSYTWPIAWTTPFR